MQIELQDISKEIWQKKYQLKDGNGNPIDLNLNDTYTRIAKALSKVEKNSEFWEEKFLWAMQNGATPAGRIVSNAGADDYKTSVSLINCVVSDIVKDSMEGILQSNKEAGLTLAAGCGIGYEFSTLRPKGAYVSGAGAYTSGSLSFMDIFDKMCFTVSSAGGRRGAQMATFAIWHPDVEDFIKAKRTNGRFRQFNCSLLIDNHFMEAVKNNSEYELFFPVNESELKYITKEELKYKNLGWDIDYCKNMGYQINDNDEVLCKIYKKIKAKNLWDLIMQSTYDYAEPGFILIDEINNMNNNYWCENIRSTNPCGEQPLPPNGACLLGSVNLTKFVKEPFSKNARFDWKKYKKVINIFARLLDNVVDMNGLPLEKQQEEILNKRRHGMGFLGLGSCLTMLNMKYGDEQSIKFTEKASKIMTICNYEMGIELAKEKGCCPILKDRKNLSGWLNSEFMKMVWKERKDLKEDAQKYGCRFTHATSIAPTGTISLSLNNNVSNGIEPTFSHKYTRNIIEENKKSKKAAVVYSYEMLLYKKLFGVDVVPKEFSTTDNVSWKNHIDIQAAAQKWIDSSISKTINVPTKMKFKDFKEVYLYAYENRLKGVTTFRFNPENFQGVLVKDEDLENTFYEFGLENGEKVVVKGTEKVFYDGEEHDAANLYDSLKEGYYGKF